MRACPRKSAVSGMKMLYILNFAARLNQFSHSAMLAAQALGVSFHVASHFSYESREALEADERKHGIRIHHIDFLRNPLHPGNVRAYREIRALMARERFDLVHCNTPIGGVHGRLAARKLGTRAVIYQAHGFHFYKGGPLSSWLLYYPVEKWLARYTDTLITINLEDEALARRTMHTRRPGGVTFVPGIGIDTQAYAAVTVDRNAKRDACGIPRDAVLAISVGELNRNKNQQVLLHAMAQVPGLHCAICGKGEEQPMLESLALKIGIRDRVHFLGFRTDVKEIYKASDVFCLPSFREGLSASIMEAMASGLPLVCSDIRGNRDLVTPAGGLLVKPTDAPGFAVALKALAQDAHKRQAMGAYNLKRIKEYDLKLVVGLLKDIYERSL